MPKLRPNVNPGDLHTVKTLAALEPALTEGSIRWCIHKNKLGLFSVGAILFSGRKLFINREVFLRYFSSPSLLFMNKELYIENLRADDLTRDGHYTLDHINETSSYLKIGMYFSKKLSMNEKDIRAIMYFMIKWALNNKNNIYHW